MRICSTLAGAGYRPVLVGRTLPKSAPTPQMPYKQVRLRCFVNKGKLFYMEYHVRLFLFLFFKKADAFCACDLDTLLPNYLVSVLKKKPLIFDAHEIFTEVPELILRPRTQKIWIYLEQMLLPKITHAYTVNDSLASYFYAKYKCRFAVIRNLPLAKKNIKGIDSELFSHLPEKFILYQGATNLGRGLPSLIKAMHAIKLPLVIAGDGDILDELKLQTRLLHLEDKIHFLGYVKPNLLQNLTEKAHLGINLLDNMGLNSYYSLANKFLDYIMAGKPQVCMAYPEYEQLNQRYQVALLVNDLTDDALTAAINRLIDDVPLYQTTEKNCQLAAQDLCWEKEQGKLLAFYSGIFLVR